MSKQFVVVGGGIAGLTAALTLASKRQNVVLIEKNSECGGLINSFERGGFRFESGARALVNAGLIKPINKQFHLHVEFLPNPVSLILGNEVLRIEGRESIEDYVKILKKMYPESTEDIDKIRVSLLNVIRDMNVLYGAENPFFMEKRKNLLVVLPSLFVWLIKLMRTFYRIGKLSEPIGSYIKRLTKNPSLRDIIIQHFFKNTPAFFVLSYFTLYNDYIYPKGGLGEFSKKLAEKIQEYGGKILLKTQIVKVDVASRILYDAHGNTYPYDNLIWAADLKYLYTIVSNVSPSLHNKFYKEKEKILRGKGAESVFSLYLALNVPPEFFEKIVTGHIFYTPRKEGLGELFGAELTYMLDHWSEITKHHLFSWLERYCEYNTFEISIPILRDKSAAPQGKTGMIVSLLFDYELTKKIQHNGWYDEFKKTFEHIIIKVLSRGFFKGIEEKIIDSFSATPLTIHEVIGSSEGSIIGWSFEEDIPVTTSMMKMTAAVKTTLPHVFKAGQWSFSPAGGPTAIMTGRLAATMSMKK